jgi:hypothetical protein
VVSLRVPELDATVHVARMLEATIPRPVGNDPCLLGSAGPHRDAFLVRTADAACVVNQIARGPARDLRALVFPPRTSASSTARSRASQPSSASGRSSPGPNSRRWPPSSSASRSNRSCLPSADNLTNRSSTGGPRLKPDATRAGARPVLPLSVQEEWRVTRRARAMTTTERPECVGHQFCIARRMWPRPRRCRLRCSHATPPASGDPRSWTEAAPDGSQSCGPDPRMSV